MPSATSIVARSWPDHVIGIENRLPWHLGTDLRHFRENTEGHAIIMGRKTYESIGRPLPRRENIVLSRHPIDDNKIRWAEDVSTALLLADVYSICNFKTQFFVIGGEKIYNIFYEFINKVYLTEVFTRVNGDAKFDWDFSPENWRYYKEIEYPASKIDDFPFRITTLVRRVQRHRYETVERLRRADPRVSEFLDRYKTLAEQNEALTDETQLTFLDGESDPKRK